jgi:hypothetical protein
VRAERSVEELLADEATTKRLANLAAETGRAITPAPGGE